MPDKAMISHRGEKYEIGRGRRFYGIWVAGAPYQAPIDRWPESRDGWEQAWTRFAALETPGTIAAVSPRRSWSLRRRGAGGTAMTGDTPAAAGMREAGGLPAAAEAPESAESAESPAATGPAIPASRRVASLLTGEALLVLGVVLGLAGLFPGYAGGQSLIAQGDQVVPHLLYVLAWAASAGVIALGVARPGLHLRGAERAASMFALGLSAVTFGLFVADLGEVIVGRAALGTGLVVSVLGWLASTAGAAIALRAAWPGDAPATAGPVQAGPAPRSRPRLGLTRPGRGHAGPLALLVLAAIGTVATFAPSWDSYTLAAAAAGTTQTITVGNAFANPGLVIAGNVAVMVAVIAIAVLAALWRPARQGALLLAGAIVPLAAQAVSALIQVGQPATAAMFGISRAQASAAGLTISSGVTPIFWVYCVFVIALLISCAWLFTTPAQPAMPAMPGMPSRPWPPIAGEDPAPGAGGDLVREDADSGGGTPGSAGGDSGGGAEDNEHSAYA